MKDETLLVLVRRAQDGDAAALRELCEAKGRDVLYNCISRMGNLHDGEDAAQEVFIRVQKGIGKLKDPEAFGVWLNRIITNTCHSQQRGRMNPRNMNDIDSYMDSLYEDNQDYLPAESSEQVETQRQVLACMRRLPTNYQEVLFLYYYEELSAPQIAKVLGRNKNTVEHTLRRARSALRRQVEKSAGAALGGAALVHLCGALHTEALALVPDTMVHSVLEQSGIFAAAAAGIGAAATATATAAGTAAGAGVAAGAAAGAAVGSSTLITIVGSGLLATAIVAATAAGSLALSAPAQTSAESPQHTTSLHMEDFPQESSDPDFSLLEVDSDSSSSSRYAASSSSGPPAELEEPPGSPSASFNGRVVFCDTAGQAVAGGAQYAAGFTAQLVQGGTVVAQTRVDSSGAYHFTASLSAGEYTLRLHPNSSAGFGFTGATPGGTAAFTYTGGDTGLPTIYLTDTRPPTALLQLHGAGGERVSRDVASATLDISDETQTSIEWKLYAADDSIPLFDGTDWEALQPLFSSLEATRDGRGYTLVVTITDLSGNTTQLNRDFVQFA